MLNSENAIAPPIASRADGRSKNLKHCQQENKTGNIHQNGGVKVRENGSCKGYKCKSGKGDEGKEKDGELYMISLKATVLARH